MFFIVYTFAEPRQRRNLTVEALPRSSSGLDYSTTTTTQPRDQVKKKLPPLTHTEFKIIFSLRIHSLLLLVTVRTCRVSVSTLHSHTHTFIFIYTN